jgi:hypothetical protein
MGRNEAAFAQSLRDLYGFLATTWDLP